MGWVGVIRGRLGQSKSKWNWMDEGSDLKMGWVAVNGGSGAGARPDRLLTSHHPVALALGNETG